MLYSELKSIMEAEDTKEEPKLDADGNPVEAPKKVVKKTKKQKELDKTTADGIGNESADMADKLATLFDTQESFKVNGSSIKTTSSDNIITLKGAANATTRDGQPADPETILTTLQLLTKAKMDTDFDKFDLGGIEIVGPDLIMTVSAKSATPKVETPPV